MCDLELIIFFTKFVDFSYQGSRIIFALIDFRSNFIDQLIKQLWLKSYIQPVTSALHSRFIGISVLLQEFSVELEMDERRKSFAVQYGIRCCCLNPLHIFCQTVGGHRGIGRMMLETFLISILFFWTTLTDAAPCELMLHEKIDDYTRLARSRVREWEMVERMEDYKNVYESFGFEHSVSDRDESRL